MGSQAQGCPLLSRPGRPCCGCCGGHPMTALSVWSVCRSDSEHRFWKPCEVDAEVESAAVSESLRSRQITFAGRFEPVQHRCRAPRPDGRLCERQDRLKVRRVGGWAVGWPPRPGQDGAGGGAGLQAAGARTFPWVGGLTRGHRALPWLLRPRPRVSPERALCWAGGPRRRHCAPGGPLARLTPDLRPLPGCVAAAPEGPSFEGCVSRGWCGWPAPGAVKVGMASGPLPPHNCSVLRLSALSTGRSSREMTRDGPSIRRTGPASRSRSCSCRGRRAAQVGPGDGVAAATAWGAPWTPAAHRVARGCHVWSPAASHSVITRKRGRDTLSSGPAEH